MWNQCSPLTINTLNRTNVTNHLVFVGCLCAADEQVLVTLCGYHNGSIGLEVEVLLATQLDGALHHMVSSCKGMDARAASAPEMNERTTDLL